MAIEGRTPRDELVQRIMRLTLGSLVDWSEPTIEKTVGPYFPDAFKEHANKRDNLLRECREYLDTFDDELLEMRFSSFGWALGGEDQDWHRSLKKKVEIWERDKPFLLAGGFGRTDQAADFGYWAKMAHLTLHELLCLSVGVDPELYDKKALMEAFASKKKLHPTIDFLRLRHEQLKREFSPYSHDSSIVPQKARAWIDKVQLEVPDKFLQAIGRVDAQAPVATTLKSSGVPDGREKTSLSKLLVAMAIDNYGYVPDAMRGPIPKEIQDMMAVLGLEISQDTIRKYLQIGAKHLPNDWKPKVS